MKVRIILFLTFSFCFLTSFCFGQKYKTSYILYKADSILKLRIGDSLYNNIECHRYNAYYYYKNPFGIKKLNSLGEDSVTKGRFVLSRVVWSISIPFPKCIAFDPLQFNIYLEFAEDLHLLRDNISNITRSFQSRDTCAFPEGIDDDMDLVIKGTIVNAETNQPYSNTILTKSHLFDFWTKTVLTDQRGYFCGIIKVDKKKQDFNIQIGRKTRDKCKYLYPEVIVKNWHRRGMKENDTIDLDTIRILPYDNEYLETGNYLKKQKKKPTTKANCSDSIYKVDQLEKLYTSNITKFKCILSITQDGNHAIYTLTRRYKGARMKMYVTTSYKTVTITLNMGNTNHRY